MALWLDAPKLHLLRFLYKIRHCGCCFIGIEVFDQYLNIEYIWIKPVYSFFKTSFSLHFGDH